MSACFVASFTCPPDCRFNPYALTCVKLVKHQKRWSEAKLHCEQTEGDFLMTLATTQSAMWLQEQHRIGGKQSEHSFHKVLDVHLYACLCFAPGCTIYN